MRGETFIMFSPLPLYELEGFFMPFFRGKKKLKSLKMGLTLKTECNIICGVLRNKRRNAKRKEETMKEIIEKLERISETLRYYQEKGRCENSYTIGQMEQREGILFTLKAMGYKAAENNGKWEVTKA